VPVEQGEVIAQALERATENGGSALGIELAGQPSVEGVRDSAAPATGNSWRAQQADALVAMAKAYLSGGNGSGIGNVKPSSAADHYQVVIHTDASALRGGAALRGGISVDNSALREGPALKEGAALHGGLGRSDLPVETVRRLTCDGSLITIIEDDEGTPLDVGRKRRTVTTALKRALWARDRHCSFPAATTAATSMRITSSIGWKAGRRASRTSHCSARFTTRCYTRADSRLGAMATARFTFNGRTGA
jgi:hypothetical protein